MLSEHQIYAFGDNEHGQCTGLEGYYIIPVKIDLKDILEISAGGAHSLFLTKDKKVYSCGYNNCGQLGLGGSINEMRTLSYVKRSRDDILTKIVDIEAGEETSAAISSDGKLFL